MKLLVYGDIGGSGGYVRYCKGLFGHGFVPTGFEVFFVCSDRFAAQLRPMDRAVQIFSHSWMDSPHRWQRYLWHLLLYPYLVHKLRPDVEFYPSGQLRVLTRHPIAVTTCHSLLLHDPAELASFPESERAGFAKYGRRQKRWFSRATGIIFPSDYSHRMLASTTPGFGRSVTIPHGLDKNFSGAGTRSYVLCSPITILYVSPVLPYKHHREVIVAIKLLRETSGLDIRLRLVGGGEARQMKELDDFISESGCASYVANVGIVPYGSITGEYETADIFVFASSCESFGITLLEAMGAGLPIACSNRSGLPEMLGEGGVYFDPDDSRSIAGAIERLLESEDMRRELGQKALSLSGNYSWERTAYLTFDFIQRLYNDERSKYCF